MFASLELTVPWAPIHPVTPSVAEARPGLEPVNPVQDPNWDAVLPADARLSVFHTAVWAQVLQEAYGYQPVYFVRQEGRRLKTVVPMMEVTSRLTGRRGVSLPFTDLCPPLVSDRTDFQETFADLVAHARKRHWQTIGFRGSSGLLDSSQASMRFFGHHLDLSGGEDELFRGVEPAVRRAVRKAQQEGVTVEFSTTSAAVEAFYELHCRTRRRQGVPPQPSAFFSQLQRYVLDRGYGFVALALYRQTPIAAAVFLRFGQQAVFKYGASDRSRQHLRGNNLVMWEAICSLARAGCRQLDFGRTSVLNEGLRRFKLGWGAVESILEYWKYDLQQRAFVTEQDLTGSWARTVFRALPIPALRACGALLYRHLG